MIHYLEMTPDHLPDVFHVRIQTWHHPHGAEELDSLGITPSAVRAMIQSTHRGWVAEADGRLVGFVIGNQETGEMWVIAVLKAWENQGIGRNLMRLVETWLASEGCQELWLTTDPDESYRAVGFYRHLGWEDWKMEDGDRYMRKRLFRPAHHPIQRS